MEFNANIHAIMSSGNKRPAGVTTITPAANDDRSLPKRRIEDALTDEEMTLSTSFTTPWSADNEDNNDEYDTVLIEDLFIVSPLGLCCSHPNCARPQIVATDRSIRDHLRSHQITFTPDLIQNLLKRVEEEANTARLMQSLEFYRMDNKIYTCFTCGCGKIFTRRDNAIAHCSNSTTQICVPDHITTATAIKLRCGRYVTDTQAKAFLTAMISKKLRNYKDVRDSLIPFLPEKEKGDDSYTPMFYPLFLGCADFVAKIKQDRTDIHTRPDARTEPVLLLILHQAKYWLLNNAKYDIVSLPGQIRAALQSFEGLEVNEISQRTTYTMQHNPSTILPVLKKLLVFAYRRGMFTEGTGFESENEYSVARFLAGLLHLNPWKRARSGLI